MKKYISIFTLFTLICASCFADGLTATLQKGEYMKPFYGVDAFKNALAEAEDSCVITLSPGLFNTVDSIKHSVTVRGTYGFDPSKSDATILSSLGLYANNITIEGVHISGSLTIGNVSDTYIKRCYVRGTLFSSVEHTNTLVDQCAITKDDAIQKGKNYCLKNTTIGSFGTLNTKENPAYISNCVVWNFIYSHTYIGSGYGKQTITSNVTPYAIYKNNILYVDITSYKYTIGGPYNNYFSYVMVSPNEFYNNYFNVRCYDTYEKSYETSSFSFPTFFTDCITFAQGCINSSNIIKNNQTSVQTKYPAGNLNLGNGQDNTPLGIYGGTGFKEYPSMPRITNTVIDQQTDTEGKIKAKITVQVEQ